MGYIHDKSRSVLQLACLEADICGSFFLFTRDPSV